MKKVISIILILGLMFTLYPNVSKANENDGQESIASKIIRFHVIANSDYEKDQKLKLKVRDKILEYMSPKLKESNSIEESRKLLKKNDSKIIKIAEEVIKDNGYNYTVKTTLSKEYFPIKTYGNITLPQGKYEAYRVVIGKGEGHNWWCVMFPPLCFTDITKGEVSKQENERNMKKILSEREYEMIDNTNDNIKSEKIIVKFKTIEWLKKVVK